MFSREHCGGDGGDEGGGGGVSGGGGGRDYVAMVDEDGPLGTMGDVAGPTGAAVGPAAALPPLRLHPAMAGAGVGVGVPSPWAHPPAVSPGGGVSGLLAAASCGGGGGSARPVGGSAAVAAHGGGAVADGIGVGGAAGGGGMVSAAMVAAATAPPVDVSSGAAATGASDGLSPMVLALTAREAQVRAAVQMVQENNVSVRQAARTFKLPKSTLHRYVQAAVRGGGSFMGNISPPQARSGGAGSGCVGVPAAAGAVVGSTGGVSAVSDAFSPSHSGGGSPPDVPPIAPRSPPPTGFKRQRSSAGAPPPVTSPRRLPPTMAALGGLEDPRRAGGHALDVGSGGSRFGGLNLSSGGGGPLAGIQRPAAHPSHIGRTHSAPSRSGSVPMVRRPSPPLYARGVDPADVVAATSMVQIGQHPPHAGRPAASPLVGRGLSHGASGAGSAAAPPAATAEGATGVNKSSIRFLLSEPSSSGDLSGILQGSAKRRPTGSPMPLPPPASPRVGPGSGAVGGHLHPSLQHMDTSCYQRSCHSVSHGYGGIVRRDRTPPIS